jgi:hypothetical protein
MEPGTRTVNPTSRRAAPRRRQGRQTVVLGRIANTFACRSRSQPAWHVPLRSNRLIVVAVGAEIVLLGAFLWIAPIADLLHQAVPTTAGWLTALLTPAVLLFADACDKRLRHPRLA